MGSTTYKAFQAVGGGKLELVEKAIEPPAPGMVRVAVEACGVCHTDAVTVEGGFPGLSYPRVPGHEAVGRIDAIGEGVARWTIGQRVGVGFLAGRCGVCPSCRRGDFVNCSNQAITGIHLDGGYAEIMTASQHALVAIPDALQSVDAAPLQCAGVTTFNALRKSGATAGDLVAIQGVGGLGHLAIQFARHMGFQTVAIARGAGKKDLALSLGAHRYIDSEAEDPAATLRELGGASVIVATASNPATFGPLLGGLAAKGQLIVVGAGAEPIQFGVVDLLFGERSIAGRNTGTPIEIEEALNFSLFQDVRATIERVPFERAPEAYAKMLANEARFRMVLEMTQAG
ncbi:alcohol dehydrogenase [Nguyenibacter vanlangensis]|uniref:Alcohol dehydrogenase catalytic domain-containing protein n=1 Tax=Nguyenibacter vanlangensis TaxID=1216886 RepID=A0A7Y7IT61_9PROT|nr:alcohol dehydrogenase [Nguyenibacter vanlangensis]NVN09643.1 alcohol dehydrogenase catalytic domain-containing protein [Nguyenibacter vanlangensis]